MEKTVANERFITQKRKQFAMNILTTLVAVVTLTIGFAISTASAALGSAVASIAKWQLSATVIAAVVCAMAGVMWK